MEKQYLSVPLDIKKMDEEKDMFRFEGFASTFGNTDLDADIIDMGAFKKSLARRIPKLLWQHEMDEPLGVFNMIEEQEPGLFIKAQMPMTDTFVSGRVVPQIKIGSITSMSIGFSIIEATFNRDTNIRNIHEVELFEVSLVSIPANPQAIITSFKRADMEDFFKMSLKEQEELFTKGVKFSNRTAKELVGVLKHKKEELSMGLPTEHNKMDKFLKTLGQESEDNSQQTMDKFLQSLGVTKGQSLAALINREIDKLVNDNTSRTDVMRRLGTAAGIDESTVGQILNASIDCPPLIRLRGFARVLGVSADTLQRAAERDGCTYAPAP